MRMLAIMMFALVCACGGEEAPAKGGGDEVMPDTSTDVDQALSRLSPEDQKLARAQKICPVGGGPLGAMGTPVKVEVKGRTVFLCCANCIDRIKSDPDTYLAKLK